MKKLFAMILAGILSASGIVPIFAVDTKPLNWYCCHKHDGTQPTCDKDMAFIEQYDGYYIDSKHVSPDSDDKVIYLTFDAGYENGNVEKILDVLRDNRVPAAFFVLENLVVKNPELIKRMSSEGHLVCNHTATHRDMTKIRDRDVFASELTRLKNACLEHAGVEIAPYYRPPEGRFSEENLVFAQELGYKTIFWSFGYVDWDNEQQMGENAALEKILGGLHNGEVLLLHPTSATNAAIMKRLIDELCSRGYRFGTLDELTVAGEPLS